MKEEAAKPSDTRGTLEPGRPAGGMAEGPNPGSTGECEGKVGARLAEVPATDEWQWETQEREQEQEQEQQPEQGNKNK